MSEAKCRTILSLSWFSISWIMCRYVSCVVVTLECPKRLAILAMDTPAYIRSEAWVCLRQCTEITGTPAFLHSVLSRLFIVELKILPLTKIGSSTGNRLARLYSWLLRSGSIGRVRFEEGFFVSAKPPSAFL
jgi:hypothetical protein